MPSRVATRRTFARISRFLRIPLVLAMMLATLAALALPGWLLGGSFAPVARAAGGLPSNTADFKPDVVYQVMLDRFFDGNSANNDPAGDTGLYDGTKANWKLYWGGDLAGLTQKIAYLAGMGVTALWISPPVDNSHLAVYTPDWSGPQAGYHGYWARDFYKIDPHLGTWADFDTLVSTAHASGIKVMVDFAPNHSNPNDTGEFGSIYNNGTFQAAYNNDPNGWFHHNGGITNWDDQYQDEYYNLADLADLAQENGSVDGYLRGAMTQLLNHGIDGVRVDAVKHMPGPTGGWGRTLADQVGASSNPHYMIGEWYLSSINDPTYWLAKRYANQSGISLLNFPLNVAIRNVFGSGQAATQLDSVLGREAGDFTWLNDQGVFVDNHDMSRFLTLNNSTARLHEALAVTLTAPGVPIIYYGTEQYLHNDTNGGGDPYNRPMMPGFSTTTQAYSLIHSLATLRHSNSALAYGTYRQRWMNSDVFIFERQFYNSVVLVAVNKGGVSSTISGLVTSLPSGGYGDYLAGGFGGNGITVGGGGAVGAFNLGANAISVWQFSAAEPGAAQIGSVGPELARPGGKVIIDGEGFGSTTGTVKFGATNATVQSWSSHSITVTAPSIAGGQYGVQVCTATCSNSYPINVESAAQVPVTFTVYNAPATSPGDNVYLTGQFAELSNWSTTTTTAIGPAVDPNYPNWFIMASVPACWTMQYKFIIIRANGAVQWENGGNHSYTAPCSGPGYNNVTWQN